MTRFPGAALALGLALAASTAHAQADLTRSSGGYTYFHRAGADMAAHDAALRFCFEQAATTKQPDSLPMPQTYDGGAAGVLARTIVKAAFEIPAERRGFFANMESCMVVTGWQVVRLPDAEGASIAALPLTDKYQHLTGLVGQDVPQGEVVRRFRNDIPHPDTRWLQTTGDLDKIPLDLQALDVQPWWKAYYAKVKTDAKAVKAARKAKPALPAPKGSGPVPQTQWAQLAADRSYLLIRTLRTQGWPTGRFLFRRIGPDPTRSASELDGQIDVFFADLPVNKKVEKGKLIEASFMLELPPGRWTYMGILGYPASGMPTPIIVSFCLGAPTFEIQTGEVLYAGTFGIGILEGQIAPDTRLETIKHLTDSAPGLLDRLKAAPWMNGDRFACDGAYIYALETPDRPFLPDYHFGSQAGRSPRSAESASADEPKPVPPAPAL